MGRILQERYDIRDHQALNITRAHRRQL